MGATDWFHVVPYQPDLARALDDLHRRVLADGAFSWPYRESPEDPLPATLEEIRGEPGVAWSGTHSVLDLDRVIPPEAPDGHGTLRWLTDVERRELLGAARPARADFVTAYGDGTGPLLTIAQRWSGHAVPLHDGGTPSALAIWGYSGD